MTESADHNSVKLYRTYLEGDLKAARLFQALADMEDDPSRHKLFQTLIDGKIRQVEAWAKKLDIRLSCRELFVRGMKLRMAKLGASFFGTGKVLQLLMYDLDRQLDVHTTDPFLRTMVLTERHHNYLVRELAMGRPTSRTTVLWGGGNIRAAVLGMNDGLVSNFSLVMGVAGATGNAEFVLLAGIAGLLAGAFSMAAGEYVSMRSQRDIYEHAIHKKKIQIRDWPRAEEEELAYVYRTKGLSFDTSRIIAREIFSNPKIALDTLVHEELGLDHRHLGMPWGASASSFFAFGIGALVPILPYLFGAGNLAFVLSGVFSAVSLMIVGVLIALISDKSVLLGGLRMLLAGGLAAAVTFGVGNLVAGMVIN